MNDLLFLAIIYLGFLIGSYFFYRWVVKIKSIWAIISTIIYLILIDLWIELFNQIHNHLRDRGIYIELGHASLELVMLWQFCYANAVILIIFIVSKRAKYFACNKNSKS